MCSVTLKFQPAKQVFTISSFVCTEHKPLSGIIIPRCNTTLWNSVGSCWTASHFRHAFTFSTVPGNSRNVLWISHAVKGNFNPKTGCLKERLTFLSSLSHITLFNTYILNNSLVAAHTGLKQFQRKRKWKGSLQNRENKLMQQPKTSFIPSTNNLTMLHECNARLVEYSFKTDLKMWTYPL